MQNQNIAKEYIEYNPELRIITCIQHKYAIIPGNDSSGRSHASRHFQEIHKPALSKSAIDPINEYISNLNLTEPSQIATPSRENGPIDGLELYENGGECLICGEYSINPGAMCMHYTRKHNSSAIEGVNWRKQPVQMIFQ